jgi:predicted alpha/beta superfamily hydrolase
VDLYPWFYKEQGTIQKLYNVYSPQLNNTRNIWIYLPPSYYENVLKSYDNILVMHDGQNLFDPNTAFENNAWMCQDTVDENVVAGEMEEIIIIGVENTPDRINELTYSYDPSEQVGGKGDLYLDYIQKVVLPLVVNKFSPWRMKLNRERLGILGSSLGGLISCYAGWTRSDVYGRMGCMSSSFWWNDQDFNTTILNPNKYTQPQNQVIYLDSGNAGMSNDDVVQTRTVRDHIETIKPYVLDNNLFYYLDEGGQHSETYWRKRFYIPMRALYPVRKTIL